VEQINVQGIKEGMSKAGDCLRHSTAFLSLWVERHQPPLPFLWLFRKRVGTMFGPARHQLFEIKRLQYFQYFHSLMNTHSKIIISFSPPPTHSGFLLPSPQAASALNTTICSSGVTHWDLTYPHITSLTHERQSQFDTNFTHRKFLQ